MFDSAIRQALQTGEIEAALKQLADGDETVVDKLREALESHVSARRNALKTLVAEEDEKYASAKSRFLSVRNDVLATTEVGRQAAAAQQVAAESAERLGSSTSALDQLREQRATVLRELDSSESVGEASEASSGARRQKSLWKRCGGIATTDAWWSAFGLQWIPTASIRSAARRRSEIERKVEAAERENAALRQEVGQTWNASVAAEQRAAAAAEPLLSQDPGLQASYDAVKVAEEVLRQAIREKAALPEIRRWINDALLRSDQRLNRTFFDTSDTSGLAQMTAPEHEIPTKAFTELGVLLEQMGGGSVGISGPRGSGKSTVIRSWCNTNGSRSSGVIGVVVPAPVEYEPREFLLHLFAELCKRVAPGAIAELHPPNDGLAARSVQIVRGVGSVAAIAGGISIARDLIAGGQQSTLVASLLLIVCVLGLIWLARFSAWHRQLRPTSKLPLSNIWFRLRSRTAHAGPEPVFLVAVLCGSMSALALRKAEATDLPGIGVPAVVIAGGSFLLAFAYALAVLGRRRQMNFVRPRQYLTETFSPHKLLAPVGAFIGAALLATLPLADTSVQPGLRLAAAVLLLGGLFGGVLSAAALEDPVALDRYTASTALSTVGLVSVPVGLGTAVSAVWSVNIDGQIVWGTMLMGIGLALLGYHPVSAVNPLDHDEEYKDLNNKRERMTAEALRRIRFLQTTTRGWSNALKLGSIAGSPLTAEQSATGGVSLVQAPVTYPDLVADFHDYVRALTSAGEIVIIGIDELDKLSAEAADRFMNGIKAVFDGAIHNCYYLVSISEEALASFDQRGLLARNVFDTAFDAMLKVEYLTLEGTIALLDRRLIDVPRGAAALCHSLSGGLARDVIRFMRLMVRVRGDETSISLADLSAAVCRRELTDRLSGLVTASRSLKDWHDVRDLSAWARALDIDDVASMNNVPPRLLGAGGDPDRAAALSLLRLHCCSFYQLATVMQFFAIADSERIKKAVLASGVGSFQRLADARNEIGTNVALAWQEIADFRTAWNLSPT